MQLAQFHQLFDLNTQIYLKGYLLCYAESMNLPTERVLEDYIRVYKNSARSENG